MNSYFFIIIFLCFGALNAQRIILCKAYTNNGEPIDLIYESKFNLDQSVCVLFLGERKTIAGSRISLFIDRINGAERQNRLKKIFTPTQENWIAHVYKFTSAGRHEIYFADENNNRYSSKSVNVVDQSSTKKVEPTEHTQYPNTEVMLCERIQGGKPVNIKRTVSLQIEGGMIYIYIYSHQPLNTEKILINIWRRAKYDLDYAEFVESKKYQIDSTWNDTFFRYKFGESGDYKIELYDEKELLIKTAYISVTN